MVVVKNLRISIPTSSIYNMLFLFGKQNKFKNTYPLIISIALTQLIQIRPYLLGNFYGDPFDGRLQIVLHEHWFRFFSGITALRDTNFFYPYEYGLGLSDPFVIQGFIHTFFRFFGFDMYDSWAASNIIMIFLGNLGLALIAHSYFKSNAIKFFFVLINGISYTYVAHIYLHPNITGFALIPYIFYFAIHKNIKIKNRIALIYVSFLMLAITSWYGFVFTLLFGVIYLLFKFQSLNISCIKEALVSKILFFSIIITAPIPLLFFYIHLPVLNDVTRTKDEMLLNSPNFDNILNASQLGGGLFNSLYSLFGLSPSKFFKEYEIGITFTFLLIFIISFILLISKQKNIKLLHLWFTNIIILALFFKINNFSVFSLFWDTLPIISSIRIPIRYLIIFAAINIFIFLAILDKYYMKNIKGIRFWILVFLLLIISFDQFRLQTSNFVKKDYQADKKIVQTLVNNKNCKAFYLDSEGIEWWNDQLDAMIISSTTGIPTVNGYSGGYPKNYPNQDWRGRADLGRVREWLINNNAINETCLLKRNYSTLFTQSPIVNIISGFDLTEVNNNKSWNWSIDEISEIKIYNFQQKKLTQTVIFSLQIPPCLKEKSVEIYFDDKFQKKIELNQKNSNYLFKNQIILNPERDLTIKFKTDSNLCSVPNDPRTLNFNLLDIEFI